MFNSQPQFSCSSTVNSGDYGFCQGLHTAGREPFWLICASLADPSRMSCILSHILLTTSEVPSAIAELHSHWFVCACTEAHVMPKQQ